ncbi:Etp1p [Rhodotorula paludigena]|uniref:Etp1p n=1 Tax=Rhodotorula paludigena TaxID=86838 RepID=UPI003179925C
MPEPPLAPPRFAVVLELYDPALLAVPPSPSPSPLLPTTRTRLPPQLDSDFRAKQSRLVLPKTGKSFWDTPLPASRPLDTRTPGVLSSASLSTSVPSPSAAPTSPPVAPRTWSESFGLPSPPAVATADLWTPSKGQLPTTSHKAILDFRFGPLAIDWIVHPEPRGMAPLVSPRPAAASLPGQRQPSPSISRSARPPESSGTTETYWGTIHLYREQGAEPSSMDEKRKAKEADDGRAVALVSVPGVLNAAALLEFIAPALDDVEQVRMLRDATPNRSIVLVRFRDAATADQFRRVFNGRPYHDSKDSEICHVVSLSSVKLKTTSTPPFTFPSLAPPSSDGSSPPTTLDPTTGRELVELPTCPVCLDVLDTRASGLVQIMCQHAFHCTCLLRWRDSRCPVCRYTNARQRRNSSSDTSDAKCAVCQSPSNLWICVICGNVGCGRYQGGHAHSHFGETGHSYSLEIATGRIWSYLDDEYVHRLIRLRPSDSSPSADERLIELPSFSTAAAPTRGGPSTPDPDDLTAKIAQQGPDRSAEVEQDKLEALAVSYGDLMSSQLDSQREYYEGEVAREKDRVRMSERKRDELERDVARLTREASEAERRARDERAHTAKEREALEAQVELLRREAAREADERRKERAEAVRARKALERDLEAERAVTASLSSNLAALRGDMAQQQRDTAGVRNEVDELKDQINDLMAALTLRDRIEQAGPDSELAGASLGVAPNPQAQQDTVPRNPSAAKAAARRKKKK